MKHIIIVLLVLVGLSACSTSKKAAKAEAEAAMLQELLDSIPETAEVMPQFQGGNNMKFRSWVTSNINYPTELFEEYVNGFNPTLEGRVTATFVVEHDGSVKVVEILSAPNRAFGDEVKRVIRSSPKWTPGIQKGEFVRVRFTMPVNFSLSPEHKASLEEQRRRRQETRGQNSSF